MSLLRLGSSYRLSRVQHATSLYRFLSQIAENSDIRTRLMTDLKSAMKSKDTVKSVTIRSVLSEVYAADKATPDATLAPPSTILSILRKAATRRSDSAAEFEKAAREDLAAKERHEAELLLAYLPPLMAQTDVDSILREVIAAQKSAPGGAGANPKKVQGLVLKGFYARVDRSGVDTDLVKRRVDALLAEASS